jgi:hypothetical protein
MPSLSEAFATLAQNFATEVLVLARSASIEDIIAETSRAPALERGPEPLPSTVPPKRMGLEMIDSVANLVVRYVKSHQGSRSEAIRKELGIPKNKWAVPLALALSTKGLSKKGQKRATTYWVK